MSIAKPSFQEMSRFKYYLSEKLGENFTMKEYSLFGPFPIFRVRATFRKLCNGLEQDCGEYNHLYDRSRLRFLNDSKLKEFAFETNSKIKDYVEDKSNIELYDCIDNAQFALKRFTDSLKLHLKEPGFLETRLEVTYENNDPYLNSVWTSFDILSEPLNIKFALEEENKLENKNKNTIECK